MRMPPEGKPFVPPNPVCPVEQEGTISDVGAVLFRLFLDPHPNGDKPTGVCGIFNTVDELGNQKDYVRTDWLELPPDSPVIRKLYEILPLHEDMPTPQTLDVDNTESPLVEKVRSRFCERIAKCRGVVNGECWALGVPAVQEVISEALRDYETPSSYF